MRDSLRTLSQGFRFPAGPQAQSFCTVNATGVEGL